MNTPDDGFIVFPFYGNPMQDIDPKRFRKSLQRTLVAAEYGRVVEERDRARDVAVALEQENARLTHELSELRDAARGLSIVLDNIATPGDVVGQEGLPLGDPWSEVPDPWRDEP